MEKQKAVSVLSVTALLVILIVSMIGTLPSVSAKELGSVNGIVVDEDGIPLSEVKITVYESTDVISATGYTDDEGFFRFALYGGSYKLSFVKEGYIEIERSVTVPDNAGLYYDPENDPVKLGEITLKKALRLTTSVITRLVNPGQVLLFPITMSNIGEGTEDVELSAYGPERWATRILDQTGEIRRVLLSSGSSISLNLEVKIPSTATGNAVVSLTASGKTNHTINFNLIVQRNHEIKLSSIFPYVSSEVGESISYPLTVTNAGEMDEKIYLASIINDGWGIRFIASDKTEVLQVYLLAGKSEQLTAEVTPSIDAGIGVYNITIMALSIDGGLMASLDLMAKIREATEKVEVATTFKEITVEAGKTLKYPITIRNKGEEDSLVLLNMLSIPDNWNAVFVSGDTEFSQVLVAAGEVISLNLKVTPPSVVSTGRYKVVFAVESDDGSLLKQIDLGANIIGSYKLTLGLSTLYTSATSRGSTSFTVSVTNTGQSPVTALSLDVDAPSGWDVSVTPVQVASVASKDSTTFNVLAKIPDNTVAGDYMITVKAGSDQVSSDGSQLRVTVSAPTSWGLIGVGIAGIAIVGLIVVFKKFSRR